jgi:hypothetical protein
MFRSKYEEPTMSEGFSGIVSIDWRPNFSSEKEKEMFLQRTE